MKPGGMSREQTGRFLLFLSNSCNLTSALFHHKPSAKIVDYERARRDNRDSDWGSFEGRPSTKTTLETAPKPFQCSFRS